MALVLVAFSLFYCPAKLQNNQIMVALPRTLMTQIKYSEICIQFSYCYDYANKMNITLVRKTVF